VLVGGFVLLEVSLWTSRPYRIAFGLLTLAYFVVGVILRRHSAEELGLSRRGIKRGWWALVVALAIAAAMMLVSWNLGMLHGIPRGKAVFAGVALYLIWSLEQEFMLQGFFFLGVRRLAGERWAIVGSALVFAVAHLPNPVLMAATLLGGAVFTAIFARCRNLVAVGVVHAIMGLTLASTAPDSVNHDMHVGRGYHEWNVGIAPARPPIPVGLPRASLVRGDKVR
jgi:membrane protease YdiL (CAAX protease family)